MSGTDMEKALEASLDLSKVLALFSWLGVWEVIPTKSSNGRSTKTCKIRLGKVKEMIDSVGKCLFEVIFYTEYDPGQYNGKLTDKDLEVGSFLKEDMVVLINPVYNYIAKANNIGYQFSENIMEIIDSYFH